MHKKILIAAFVLAGAALGVIAFLHYYKLNADKTQKEQKLQSSQVIVDETAPAVSEMVAYGGDEPLSTMIPLNKDETLVAVLNENLDGDNYQDEIAAVKTNSESAISLVVGFYNPETESYDRSAFIPTDIHQVSTFTYSALDLTGDHRMSIVYQGVNKRGLSELCAVHVRRVADKTETKELVRFESNDVIYIQKVDRTYGYEMGENNGDAYPVYVYSMEGEGNIKDQVSRIYKWNQYSEQYELDSESRVTAASLSSKELKNIQGGNVDSYGAFLEGMWYLTSSSSRNRSYMYFDYQNKLITFYSGNMLETYNWGQNFMRFSGIFISTVNTEIANLRRRIDISLKSADTIQVRNMDDLQMIISEGSEWDGEYKKLDVKKFYSERNAIVPEDYAQVYIDELEVGPEWRGSDGSTIKFENGSYKSTASDGVVQVGFYTKAQYMDMPFIQFRSPANSTWLNGMYLVTFAEVSSGEERDSMILQPYTLGPDKAKVSDERPLIINRIKNE